MGKQVSINPQAEQLLQIVQDQKKGIPRGIYSVCSAHPDVIAACMRQASSDQTPLLLEATCNQVNQFGGYTGMTPQDLIGFVQTIALEQGFPMEQVILGGDHLGPSPWQTETSEIAMRKARQLVRDYVQAGFTKIHLDASMRLGDDPLDQPMAPEVVATRMTALCQAAEAAIAEMHLPTAPLYIIGTEVPTPGGSTEQETDLRVTAVEDARSTLSLTQDALEARGLYSAWERVIGLVVQPGVEFSSDSIIEYNRSKAHSLSHFIETVPKLVYEAHSTDYQPCQSLKEMVEDHFAILKVGPGLTFAFREAIFALALIEQEWLALRSGVIMSGFFDVLEQVLKNDPRYWAKYYLGDQNEVAIFRKYSFSDRIRYYWPNPEIKRAISRLLYNLKQYPPPLTMISQYLPNQYLHLRSGLINNFPVDLIRDRIQEVAVCYSQACSPPA